MSAGVLRVTVRVRGKRRWGWGQRAELSTLGVENGSVYSGEQKWMGHLCLCVYFYIPTAERATQDE